MAINVKEHRIKKGYTQDKLSKKIGVTRQMITAYENSSSLPSPKVAKKLGEILGFDWTKFFE